MPRLTRAPCPGCPRELRERIRTGRRRREGKPGKGSGCPLWVGRVLSDGPELMNSGSGRWVCTGCFGSPAAAPLGHVLKAVRPGTAGRKSRSLCDALQPCMEPNVVQRRLRAESAGGAAVWSTLGAELQWCLRGCTQAEGRWAGLLGQGAPVVPKMAPIALCPQVCSSPCVASRFLWLLNLFGCLNATDCTWV